MRWGRGGPFGCVGYVVSSDSSSLALYRFAGLTVLAVLVLIGAGGLVTSHGAGMAVPDWPNTYGYNMFFFPISQWIGGIFYEHTHRLLGAAVGLLTLVLAIWMQGAPARPWLRRAGWALLGGALTVSLIWPARWQDAVVLGATALAALGASAFWPRCAPQSPVLRRLGWIAVAMVILQGILGGLRVTLYKDELGIVHATLAQCFLAFMGVIALMLSPWWRRRETASAADPEVRSLRGVYALATALVLGQLVLGATMRHEHAGLAVPDFPLAYGRLWPATDPESIARYNQQRLETRALNDITATHIYVHMAHRLLALGVLGAIGWAWIRTRRCLPRDHAVRRLAGVWLALVGMQFLLGAWTVWSNKAADVATLHVVTGAVTFLSGVLLSVTAFAPRVHKRVQPWGRVSWAAQAATGV